MSKISLELYKKIYLIRKAEEAIIENYPDDEMKTPMHMSMGAEAISVGVCAALSRADQVFGTYRNHALYLAKGGDLDQFFAEMYGKTTGTVKGKGGSMHLVAPEVGLMATSAVVASTIPVAVGAAFANKIKKNKRMVAVFFGDGAINEGAFWESLNMATLWKLPILFVLEDNELAVHTPSWQRQGFDDIAGVVAKFKCNVFKSSTTDVEQIFKLAKKAIEAIKSLQVPSFLHLQYYRYLEHVGVGQDFDKGYRLQSEFEKWRKKDPIDLQKKKLLKMGFLAGKIAKIEEEIDQHIAKSIARANKTKFPGRRELMQDVFYEKN